MRTIETTATIQEDGTLTARVPTDIPAGEHLIVLVIEEKPLTDKKTLSDWPVHDFGPWPENLSLRREDMYDDWGR